MISHLISVRLKPKKIPAHVDQTISNGNKWISLYLQHWQERFHEISGVRPHPHRGTGACSFPSFSGTGQKMKKPFQKSAPDRYNLSGAATRGGV
jgi:hypothetical protein